MSVFGKLIKESPEYVDDILRALRGEASDATTKLGSGKNLEPLQRLEADLADRARTQPKPGHPTNVVPDDLAAKQQFKLEGQPYTKEGVMRQEGVDLPAVRTNTLPETPSTFKPGDVDTTGRIISEAEDLANIKAGGPLRTEIKPEATGLADTAEKLQGSVDDLLSPGIVKGKAAVAAGTIGGGILALNQLGEDKDQKQEIQIPFKSKDDTQKVVEKVQEKKGILEKEETQSPEQAKKQAENKPVITEEDEQKVVQIGQKLFEDPKSVQKEDIDYLKMLQTAQENDNQSRFINNLLRAGTTIGAAIAGVKPDYSGVDALASQIGQTKQVKEQMEVDMGQKKLEAAQRELNDDKALRDPNSEISKQMRDSLVKAGYPVSSNVSAKNLKDMGVNVYNLLAQKQQQDVTLKAAQLKEGKGKQSFITGAQKTLLKPYQEFQKVNSAFRGVERFVSEKPSGPKDVALLYSFIKILDPGSVVREGEIQLTQRGMSLFEGLGLKAKRITDGQLLNDNFRREILNIGRQARDQAAQNYQEIARPFILNASSLGLNEDEMNKFDYMSASQGTQAPTMTQGQEKTVQVRRISDGATRVMPISKTTNLDKTKYEIIGQ